MKDLHISHRCRHLIWLLIAEISLSMLPGCSKDDKPNPDVIWDIAPVQIHIFIKNVEDQNLLVPNTKGSLYGKKIEAEYKGQTYLLDWDSNPASRAILAEFKGLTLDCGYTQTETGYVKDINNTYLSFGEFEGDINQNITITLKIEGYSESWEINLNHTFTWKKGEPVINRTYYLNGKKLKDGSPVIIL